MQTTRLDWSPFLDHTQIHTKRQNLLVTGASGLLGANALYLLKDRYNVSGTFLKHPISVSGTFCSQLDLTNAEKVALFLDDIKPDLILHTAAAVNVDECETNQELPYKTNVVATELLAQYAAKRNVKFIYISTDAFFDGKNQLFTETDTPHPLNYYGQTKLLGEQIVQKMLPNALIIRTNLYGWNYQNKMSLAEWMFFNLKEKKKIPLVKDVFYTPILTNTLIEIINQMIQKNLSGIYHVAGGESISKLDFGYLLCEVFDLDKNLIIPSSIHDLKLKATRSSNMALSTEKIREVLPSIDFNLRKDLVRFKELFDSGYFHQLKNNHSPQG